MQYILILCVDLFQKVKGWLKEQFVLSFSDCIKTCHRIVIHLIKVPAKCSKPKWRTNKQTQEIERVYF